MIWLQVRVLPAPPRSPLRTGVSVPWAQSRIFAGLFAGELTEFGLCWGCETVPGPFRSASLWPRQTVSRRQRIYHPRVTDQRFDIHRRADDSASLQAAD